MSCFIKNFRESFYLCFVQDLWIKKVMVRESKGSVLFRRYADDSIVCIERKDDAEAYLKALSERLAKFGLQLADEKSALVKFNRWEGDFGAQWLACVSTPPCYTRSVTDPSVGFVANG
jgi:hypothetical protein